METPEKCGTPAQGNTKVDELVLRRDSLIDEHIELEDGEMFLSNTNEEEYQRIGWKTKRRGNTAYDKSGNIVIRLFPVFVQKQEYDEGMEMKVQ